MTRVAVIDVGTVTARLAIAEVESGRVQRMARQSTIVNLGQDVDRTGVLREDACARLLACVDHYLELIGQTSVATVCCTLTSAARDARNSGDLLAAFLARGLKAQVIPGQVEGSLTFLGVAQDFPGTQLLVADNGGGSTEFALGALASAEPADSQGAAAGSGARLDLSYVRSIDVGCRRITEKFLNRTDPPTQADLDEAHAFAADLFACVDTWSNGDQGGAPQRLVVTGGTSTTLVALEKALVPYDSSQVHLATLSLEAVERQERRLAALTVAERAELAGIQPQRAPVILGGAVAVTEIMRAAGLTQATVSESDLLFGLSLVTAAAVEGAPSVVGWAPEV